MAAPVLLLLADPLLMWQVAAAVALLVGMQPCLALQLVALARVLPLTLAMLAGSGTPLVLGQTLLASWPALHGGGWLALPLVVVAGLLVLLAQTAGALLLELVALPPLLRVVRLGLQVVLGAA